MNTKNQRTPKGSSKLATGELRQMEMIGPASEPPRPTTIKKRPSRTEAFRDKSGIQLVWPNKDRTLFASGATDYAWGDMFDNLVVNPPVFEAIAKDSVGNRENVLATSDGLDVLEALTDQTKLFRGGIRLVCIDPPFNTQVNLHQYGDTMNRATRLKMNRDGIFALRRL